MMNEELKEARNEYYRQWRAKNPDKVAAAQQRYWQKQIEKRKAEQARAASEQEHEE